MSQAHWVMPLVNSKTGGLCRCPRCNKALPYGARRSLWSLLPGICIHRVVSWDDRVERYNYSEGLAFLSVGKTIPLVETGLKAKLRGRLLDELKHRRRFWWAPLTR
jgi:hypothetical protein